MRTTIDLPDDLFRRAKAVAALRGMSLKELIGSFVEAGLGLGDSSKTSGHKSPLPEFLPRTGTPVPSLTNAEIEEILMKEDLAHIGPGRSS